MRLQSQLRVAKVAVTRGLPSEIPIPAVLIGQLAVDQRFQGQGKGSLLLIDALKRSKELGLGWAVVVVDAFDEKAAQWYETFGFIRISSKPTRLIIPRITVEKLP
ncbi:MAG: GNAT family N-acetyltransferase [Ignavibacteria bacterium]|nr:GNAT family N-acetyltransferase [Ignavibacteria bacterium]